MANILKRTWKDGSTTYRVIVRIKGHPALSASFDRLAEARAWAATTEASVREGRFVQSQGNPASPAVPAQPAEPPKPTVGDLILRYMRDVLPQKPRSERVQGQQLRWWLERLGNVPLNELTPVLLVTCRDELARGLTPRGTLRAPASVNRYLAAISHVFSIAIRDWGALESNPLERVTRPREPRGRVRYLSDDERERLLAACKDRHPALYPVVVLAMYTGMRQGEIMGLRWRDVSLEEQRVILEHTKNGERRRVPLPPPALEALQVWRRSHAGAGPKERVFASEVNPDAALDLRTPWETARERAGLEDFHFHDLRHTTASYLAMSGASLAEISEILGHRTLSMVKRYAHLSESHTAGVLTRMSEKFSMKKV